MPLKSYTPVFSVSSLHSAALSEPVIIKCQVWNVYPMLIALAPGQTHTTPLWSLGLETVVDILLVVCSVHAQTNLASSIISEYAQFPTLNKKKVTSPESVKVWSYLISKEANIYVLTHLKKKWQTCSVVSNVSNCAHGIITLPHINLHANSFLCLLFQWVTAAFETLQRTAVVSTSKISSMTPHCESSWYLFRDSDLLAESFNSPYIYYTARHTHALCLRVCLVVGFFFPPKCN